MQVVNFILILIFTIGILACRNKETSSNKSNIKKSVNRQNSVGSEIQGDFNGDGVVENALVKFIEVPGEDDMENGRDMEYSILFSGNNITPIKEKFYEITLINEGDLNNDGADELSVFQSPENGCVHSLRTYSFSNNNWKEIIDPFPIPTDCEELNTDELQGKIFNEKGEIYKLVTDPSTDPFTIQKEKVEIK